MTERIEIHPNVHFGKPCVAGTRIQVIDVLELLRQGLSFRDIVTDYYPDLEPEDIRACLRYAMELVAVEEVHVRISA
jgi:uncharacterized protein (DUF433 family)